jgi:hypothetical protein
MEQQAGVLKNERLSLILATYQRNLEITERKLVASQQENIDLHIQIKQLIQNSSKLQNQIKEMSSSNLLSSSGKEKPPAAAAPTPAAVAAAAALEAQQQQQQQYMTMYAALTEQIKELKQQMLTAPSAPAVTAPQAAPATPASSAAASTATLPKVKDTSKEDLGSLSRQSSGILGHLSRALSPAGGSPTGTPPRKPSIAKSSASPEVFTITKVPSEVGIAPETVPLAKDPSAQTVPARPPTPAEELITANNPHGFRTMAECLQHIAALEANSHAALTAQLQKAQQRATDLTLRNAALEEELGSYQAYMRDVVPQYKKQLQYMKAQLKIKATAGALSAAVSLPVDEPGEKNLKLPLIK